MPPSMFTVRVHPTQLHRQNLYKVFNARRFRYSSAGQRNFVNIPRGNLLNPPHHHYKTLSLGIIFPRATNSLPQQYISTRPPRPPPVPFEALTPVHPSHFLEMSHVPGGPVVKEEVGRRRNASEKHSLIQRVECLLSVQFGKMTLNQACIAYSISSRTFYRWLQEKDRLMELTRYTEAEFCAKSNVHGLPELQNPHALPSNFTNLVRNSARMPPTGTATPKVSMAPITNVQADNQVNVPAHSSTPVISIWTQPPSEPGARCPLILPKTGQLHFPPAIAHATNPPTAPSQRHALGIHRGISISPNPIATERTTAPTSTTNALHDVPPQGLLKGQSPTHGSSSVSNWRFYRLVPISSPITKRGHGPRSNLAYTHRVSGQQYHIQNSKTIYRAYNGRHMQTVELQKEQKERVIDTAEGAARILGIHDPSAVNSSAPQTSSPTEQVLEVHQVGVGPCSTQQNSTWLESSVPRHGGHTGMRSASPPVQIAESHQIGVDQGNVLQNSAFHENSVPRQGGHTGRHSGPPANSTADGFKRELEVMKGRRKIVFVFYGKVLISDIKCSISRKFGLPDSAQWGLTDTNGNEVIVSSGIPSGRYYLQVFY